MTRKSHLILRFPYFYFYPVRQHLAWRNQRDNHSIKNPLHDFISLLPHWIWNKFFLLRWHNVDEVMRTYEKTPCFRKTRWDVINYYDLTKSDNLDLPRTAKKVEVFLGKRVAKKFLIYLAVYKFSFNQTVAAAVTSTRNVWI